jgi:hypothetical protein
MAQSTSSGFHTHASWGRTRRPKNVNGASSTAEATTVASEPSDMSDGTITGAYFTENQRFLHLSLDTDPSGENRTITVWGFMHATGRWVPLKDTSGTACTIAANDAQAHAVYEIAGVDKVYFQVNSAFGATGFFHAALSTF